jgi:regulator-associated protein of mTOR
MSTNIQTASMKNCIQLAACSATQLLPMNPELPADLFTACLTTPIKMALRWFVMQNQGKLAPRITVEMLDKIPGMILTPISDWLIFFNIGIYSKKSTVQ